MSETDTVFVYSPDNAGWEASDQFSIPNRGMNFGDGLFETMVFDGEKIRFFQFHLERLKNGLKILGLVAPGVNFSNLERWFHDRFAGQPLRIRWNVFRSGGGKYTPETNHIVQTLHLQPFATAPRIKQNASFSKKVTLSYSPWSRCKTLSALPYVLAAMEREERSLDELILLDHRGKVSEACSSNIFWRKEHKIFTPSLSCGPIAGVGRRVCMEKLPKSIYEGEFSIETLLNADQVWVSNVTGISYLEKIDSVEFSTESYEPLLQIFHL